MSNVRHFFVLGLFSCLGACASAPVADSTTAASVDPALTREKASAALSAIAQNGVNCCDIAITAAPVAVRHIGNDNLQQTIGRAEITYFKAGDSANKPPSQGTVLATMVGKQPTGELLGNHHILLTEGTLRTENDVISITPTADKCVVTAKAKVNFKDGTGEFAGYSGSGNADATLNFCGAPGKAVVYGRVCQAQ